MRYPLLLLLFLVFQLVASDRLPVVKTPVYHNTYINILIGNPGKYTLLKLDFSVNDSLILFEEPLLSSKTYTSHPPSVLLYLGEHVIRLPALFGSDHFHDPTLRRQCEGVLSLHTYSQIWKYWHRATLSPAQLVLGDYEESLARSSYHPYEMIFRNDEPIEMYIDGQLDDNVTVFFDPRRLASLVPKELFHNASTRFLTWQKNINDEEILIIDQEDLEFISEDGFVVSLAAKHSGPEMVMGSHFLRNFALHIDIISQTYRLFPSFDSFDEGTSEPIYSYFIMMVTIIVFLFYHISSQIRTSFPSKVYSSFEIYGHILALLIVFVETSGFAAHRVLSYRMASASPAGYVILALFISLSSCVGVVLGIYYRKKTSNFGIRRTLLETSLVCALWLNQVRFVEKDTNNLAVLLLASLITNIRIVHFTNVAFFTEKKYALLAVTGIFAIFTFFFMIFYNILPILNFNYYGFEGHFDSVVFLLELLNFLPARIFFFIFLLAVIKTTIERRLKKV